MSTLSIPLAFARAYLIVWAVVLVVAGVSVFWIWFDARYPRPESFIEHAECEGGCGTDLCFCPVDAVACPGGEENWCPHNRWLCSDCASSVCRDCRQEMADEHAAEVAEDVRHGY